MPDPFPLDALLASLRPLAAAGEAGPYDAHYQRFYGFDRLALPGRLGFVVVGDYRIALQLWRPPVPRASLILLHGYYDHSGLYRHVIEWALRRQYAVLAIDLPGHGLSSGARADIGDFADYQAVLSAVLSEAAALQLPAPWHLCGQSTGGAILIDHRLHAAVHPSLGETLLLAPLVRPRAWNWSQLSHRLLSPFVSEIPRRFRVNSGDAAFIDFVHNQDPLQARSLPTRWVGALRQWIPRIERATPSRHSPIIVQGEADMTVDWRHNLGVLENKFAAPRILRLPEARHHLANELPALRDQYFAFLDQQLGDR
jgi:alpha-beta hydrolase superfamily lysophospholipase